MDDQRKSILDTLFECVNHGVEWGLNQVKNPCPPRKKYGQRDEIPPPKTELKDKIDGEVELETKVQTGVGEGSNIPNEEFSPKFGPCEPKEPYIHPDQIFPDYNEPACCFIPMQDPCRTCCCEPNEQEEEPCPPKNSHLDEPREPTCSCDFCKKNKVHGKCCPETENIFREENNGGRLERA